MPATAGGAPLIVTALLPRDLQAFADKLRRAHYPPERNRVPAHVSLFRSLPPSCEAELRDILKDSCRDNRPIQARMSGVLRFSHGTALEIISPQMQSVREAIAGRLQGLLSAQDVGVPKLHVTIQNKVSPKEAKTLQAELESQFRSRDFTFAGLALHVWKGGPWELLKSWSFRG